MNSGSWSWGAQQMRTPTSKYFRSFFDRNSTVSTRMSRKFHRASFNGEVHYIVTVKNVKILQMTPVPDIHIKLKFLANQVKT